MSTLWDGDSLADAIGRLLEERGFYPFGIGVPFVARDAVLERQAELAADPDVLAVAFDKAWAFAQGTDDS